MFLTASMAQPEAQKPDNARLQKPQMERNDFSSPENTVLSFVSALNAYDAKRTVECVSGAKESPLFEREMRSYRRNRTNMVLGKIQTHINGDNAEAGFSMDLLMEVHNIPAERTEEKIALKNDNGRWLLVPPTKENQKIFKASGYLAQLALVFAQPEMLPLDSEEEDGCEDHLEALAKAALRLAKDNKGAFFMTKAAGFFLDESKPPLLPEVKALAKGYKIPVHPQLKAVWQKALWPYRQNAVYYMCMQEWEGDDVHVKQPGSDEMPVHPVTKLVVPDSAYQSYDFNAYLVEMAIKKIKEPARTVLIYEGQGGKLNFRHGGNATVVFVDGSAAMIGPEEAKNLIWNPKGK